MSICRWSSEDFMCDIYLYEAYDGWSLNVAANRPDTPSPHNYALQDLGNKSKEEFAEQLSQWRKEYKEWSDNVKWVQIGLPYDGQSFSLDTVEEVIEKITELRRVGYNMPDWIEDELEGIKNE